MTPAPLPELSDTVRLETHGRVAVLWLDSPPVNGLGNTVRRGLHDGIAWAMGSADVDAVVVLGRGSAFSGGADIRQFNTPAMFERPLSRDIAAAIAAGRKPVVAAIHGVAFGGGLEFALACHHRLATPSAKLGLPEVTLGLVPGGGGTQRLPRLIGVERALDMVQSGAAVNARRALEIGLVDRLVEGDLLPAAVEFAAQAAARGDLPLAATRALPDAGIDFAARRAAVAPKLRNALAQQAVVDCVEAATRLSFEDGLTFERAVFERLVGAPESRALRHLFFAEREAPKVAGLPAGTARRDLREVAVLGAGTMGGGIAMAYANAGIPVVLLEREHAALDRGMDLIRRNYGVTVAKGKLSEADMARRMALIRPTLSYADIAAADLVIEAVFEDMAVKREVFARLDAVCKPGAILATNTSRLDIDEIARATTRPQDVVGLHFFSPANVMKLLEVVRGEATSQEVIASCMRMAQDIGKVPVLVRVCEGFVGNRMLTGYWREAWFLVEEGASPQQVDRALTDFGMAMGPLAMGDLAGLDINWAARKRLAPTRPAHLRYSKVADRICEAGRFGQKTGAGWYRYEPGSRTPLPDPAVDAIVEQCAAEAGITRRPIADQEIVERCMLALVNEGARLLEEGIAQRASDIDVVYVNGYGFPASRGGPMFWAETLGLERTLDKIRALERVHGGHWVPAPLLVRRVAEGQVRFDA
ncbi:3-hydroxyacyl-CoA dehydrogenase NAD-binding domain-containing protein [Aquabacterium sp. J223]|uniref:3-hydroxyacyl-CoA dehydrogenase NAD-binding domain-containing protein n=1 Tax=Aquabacterium sp. J223 TaxID=2898431 RepID=UPI0021ADD299|nr:3-hydroxyacyl-CoA dehydrogenase NAD-binding domain-containing protein [Aquabacterium sp. J223]UUX97098.1 3-hydroxyacyl-CoA dehydrogenase NAD-binding domain-containing protein [Aquabacterium sp. J223]